MLRGWCFGLLPLGLGFCWSLKWTYENGCVAIRRIKVSFLSVQICVLRWTRCQWPDIITPFLLSPVHSRLSVSLARKPMVWSLSELKWSPQCCPVCRLALQPYRVARRLLCTQCIVLKVWPLTNLKPLSEAFVSTKLSLNWKGLWLRRPDAEGRHVLGLISPVCSRRCFWECSWRGRSKTEQKHPLTALLWGIFQVICCVSGKKKNTQNVVFK